MDIKVEVNVSVNEESWLPVVGFKEHYFVSDQGRVMRVARGMGTWPGKILSTSRSHAYGYNVVDLSMSCKQTTKCVHDLVLRAFVGPPPEGMEARHLDGNPKNNCLSNLLWGTDIENQHDRVAHKTMLRGEDCPWAKLSDEEVEQLRELRKAGWTVTRLANHFNISLAQASRIVNFKGRQHKAYRKEG